MKKITFILSFALATVSFSYAQNLKIILQGGNGAYWNDSTVVVYGSSSSNFFSTSTFDVINKSGDTVNIWVKRTIIGAVAAGSTNAICFAGYCGAVTLGTSKYSCYLGIGDTAQLGNAFYGDYYPGGSNGTTTIRYTFYNWNSADSGSFIVKYTSTPTGIQQLSGGQIGFSSPYPNPATTSVNFTYSLSNSIQSANLKIFNLLGECVQTLPLNALKNKTTVDVQSMPSGIYVCEIQANGCQPAYQKMVVSH